MGLAHQPGLDAARRGDPLDAGALVRAACGWAWAGGVGESEASMARVPAASQARAGRISCAPPG